MVVVALVALRSVIVPDATVKSEIVVVAKVVRPLRTVSVPLEVSDDVAVIDPPVTVPLVISSKNAVAALKRYAKKLDDVAFTR